MEIRGLTPAEVTPELMAAVAHKRVWPKDPEGSMARARDLCTREDRAIGFYRKLGFEPDYESDLKDYPFYDIDLRLR